MIKKEKKEVAIKEYITVFLVFLICVLAVFMIRNWYRNYKEYSLTIPVIKDKLFQIGIGELDAYIMEHDNFYIYIGTSSNENCRELESKLENLLSRRNIKNDTIYLNMSNVDNGKKHLMDVLSKYGTINEKFDYPMFLIIENKQILAYVAKTNSVINIGDIDKLLDEYEIGI